MYNISYNYMIIKSFFFFRTCMQKILSANWQYSVNGYANYEINGRSTAEQPRSPTVHVQQLEAEHCASPGQYLTDNLHITEPFQPTNFNFPKKTFGKQNRLFQSKWFNDYPLLHYNEQSDSLLCFICAQQNEKLNLRAARKFYFTRIFQLEEGFGTIQGTSSF